ncbi:MAG: hypothetical protein ACT4RN_23580, partial [Pseudonocardia sp.]
MSTATRSPAPPNPAPDLTTTKVLAVAGAAATSAVMGSFLGATGTVAGAALGSVVRTVGTSVYQRYLDRTRDTVRAHVRLPGGRRVSVTAPVEVPAPAGVWAPVEVPAPVEIPAQRAAEDAGAAPARVVVTPAGGEQGRVAAPAPSAAPAPAPPRRRGPALAAAALLAFALAMLAVTGVEWLKGSTLTSGESGTSVGWVLDGGPPAAAGAGSESDEPDGPAVPGGDADGRSDSADRSTTGDPAPQR